MIKNQLFLMDVRPLYDEDKFKQTLDEMDSLRVQKVNRLKTVEVKALSLGAGLLLKRAEQKYFKHGQAPELVINNCGKPSYKGVTDFYFNLSHSDYLAVCGIGPRPVGVDVQKIGAAKLSLAKRFFHQKEYDFLKQLPEKVQAAGFSQIWSAKESFIKYQGSGLGFPLNAFFLEFTFTSGVWRVENCSEPGVYFRNYSLSQEYAVWFCGASAAFEENSVWVEI
ncbi:4'-phosphopantetheinyl transferase superfamily protein [Eubacteriaceae bacterium ES3]|nr:4'-phosphopantetheinyl transferase superfamily protein [Eubacteriaceae bacterium ES3]